MNQCIGSQGLIVGAATLFSLIAPSVSMAADNQPNILWIVTDDHRADALACYNRATRGTDESALGYVSSPELDKLAAEGVLFTNSYCNSPASAPSRTSMHSGLYPHHRGVYGFEYYHDGVDFTPKMIPEWLREFGYNTMAIGKMGLRYRSYNANGRHGGHDSYGGQYLNTKDHQSSGNADWYPRVVWGNGEDAGSYYDFFFPDGSVKSYCYQRKNANLTKEDLNNYKSVLKELDVLVSYTGKGQEPKVNRMPSTLLGGVSSNTTMRTTDGAITRDMQGYMDSEGKGEYLSIAGKRMKSIDGKQPQFIYLGHHFPHTPVLPSKSFRDQFMDKKYKVPKFDQAELDKMPAQMKQWQSKTQVQLMKRSEQEQFIRDYYAFTAMGDSLIGVEVRKFKEFCKKNNKEYLILIACGDHAWHLGEQGVCAKFAAYENSAHTATIVVSSNKSQFPAGKIVSDYMEYVDFLPTFISAAGADLKEKRFDYLDGYDLVDVVSGKAKVREYTIGEIDAVCGPHGYIRTKDFMFGMRTRKNGGIPSKDKSADPNVEMRWAMDAPLDTVDPILYDMRVDPLERNNVALDPEYRKLAEFMRQKLGNIMLGDGRREVDWKQQNSYNISTFGVGSDDKKMDIPTRIIPKVKKSDK